jgi:hypothetical protein
LRSFKRSPRRSVLSKKAARKNQKSEEPGPAGNSGNSGNSESPPKTHTRVWRDALKEAFEDLTFPGWSKEHPGIVKKLGVRWGKSDADVKRYQEFIRWSVINWTAVVTNQLAWMKRPVNTPEVGFFIKRNEDFRVVFSERQITEWAGTLDGTQRLVQAKIATGLSPEAASHEVAREQALSQDRQQRMRDIDMANRALRAAERAKELAQRATRFTPPPPPREPIFDPELAVQLEPLKPFDWETFK